MLVHCERRATGSRAAVETGRCLLLLARPPAVLRNLDVRTIVGVGVSVNVAITNFVMDAVNHGYQFVLARDAVAGVPADYADAVIDNTLSLLATVVSTAAVVAAWGAGC